MTKSGCCSHQYSEFIVKNNIPKAARVVEVDETEIPYSIVTEEIWNGNKMIKTSERTIDLEQDGIKIVYSFKVEQNEKEVILFSINDRTLNYALIQKDGSVEFAYPIETVFQNPDFKFDTSKTNCSVSFVNKSASYKIYEKINGEGNEKIGIEISFNGKTYDWAGQGRTKQGSLDRLLKISLDNVVFIQ